MSVADSYYAEVLDSRGELLMGATQAGYLHGPMVEWVPGPAEKTYTERNSAEGVALHSIVGEEKEFHDGIPDRFLSMDRLPDGRFTPYAAASCQHILRKFDTRFTGYATMIQMYAFTQATWTSGGREANTKFLSVEIEGGGYLNGLPNYSEPLNDLQIRTLLLFLIVAERWMQRRRNDPKFRLVYGENVLQHKHIAQKYGYAATACASDRPVRAMLMLPQYREDLAMEDAVARQDAAAAKAQADTLNDVLVIQRDLQRAISQPHPVAWRIHALLMGAGYLVDPEFKKENPWK